MRIGLNLLHAMPEIGGGWNYIARLVESLGEYDRENHYVAFVTDQSVGLVPRRPNFEIAHPGINPISRPQRVLYENTGLQRDARTHHLDLMHWFANNISVWRSVPGVVTVYDLHVFVNPHSYTRMQRIYLRTMYPHAVRRAALLLPMSETTAASLCHVLKANSERMQVIPAIVSDSFQPVSSDNAIELRRKYGLPDQFWLYVANFLPHKNHLRLLQAYHHLKLNGIASWPLVLRGDDHGAEGEIKRLITQLNLKNDVRFLPRFDEGELPGLYSAAAALVFPSLYEGAGMPVIEAMACGCPVIAANIPPMREAAAEAASYFDPNEVASIAEAMSSFQGRDPQDRCQMRQKGPERSTGYRPQIVARKLLNAYSRALSK
jgi:glycosyltransferase involved in cell wall biosynthesis